VILPTFGQQSSVILLRKLCLRDAELVHTNPNPNPTNRLCNAHVAALIRLASNCMLTFWHADFLAGGSSASQQAHTLKSNPVYLIFQLALLMMLA